MSNAIRRLGALALVGTVATCLAFASTASAANSVTYSNSAGDPAAPDVSSVTVSNDDHGALTFAISVPSRPTAAPNEVLSVFIDPGMNPNDGAGPNFEGASLVLDVEQGSVDLGKWNGSTFDFSGGSPPTLVYSWANGVVTIKVNAADLQLTSFDFWVASIADGTADVPSIDTAPQPGHGSYRYDVKISPLTLPVPTKSNGSKGLPKCLKHHKSTKAHHCHK
jgi:hypothetical protein